MVHEVIVANTSCLGKPGTMEYERNALHRSDKRCGLCTVALHEPNIQAVKPARMSKVPHQAGDVIPFPKKAFDKMAPYKSAPTGNQRPS
jgi:hypothetical protein